MTAMITNEQAETAEQAALKQRRKSRRMMAVARKKRRQLIAAAVVRGVRTAAELQHALKEAHGIEVSRSTIGRDLQYLEERWERRYLGDVNRARSQQMAELDALKQEGWQAYGKSKKPTTKTVTEQREGGVPKVTTTVTERVGDVTILGEIRRTVMAQADLLGTRMPYEHVIEGSLHSNVQVRVFIPDNGRDPNLIQYSQQANGEGVIEGKVVAGDEATGETAGAS